VYITKAKRFFISRWCVVNNILQYKWFFYMMESESEVPEDDEFNSNNVSPQLLPNVEHLGIVCFLINSKIIINYLNI